MATEKKAPTGKAVVTAEEFRKRMEERMGNTIEAVAQFIYEEGMKKIVAFHKKKCVNIEDSPFLNMHTITFPAEFQSYTADIPSSIRYFDPSKYTPGERQFREEVLSKVKVLMSKSGWKILLEELPYSNDLVIVFDSGFKPRVASDKAKDSTKK